MFATDREYTTFAARRSATSARSRTGCARCAGVHDRNHDSGKVVHETVTDGSVYFGANGDTGNIDETAKFPTPWPCLALERARGWIEDLYPASVARPLRSDKLDADGDGWPEGSGNVEREGMGAEKLDNTVYLYRGARRPGRDGPRPR